MPLSSSPPASAAPGGVSAPADLGALSNPNYPAGAAGDRYRITSAGRVGGVYGVEVRVGDIIECIVSNAGGTQAAVGASWVVYPTERLRTALVQLRGHTDPGETPTPPPDIILEFQYVSELELSFTADGGSLSVEFYSFGSGFPVGTADVNVDLDGIFSPSDMASALLGALSAWGLWGAGVSDGGSYDNVVHLQYGEPQATWSVGASTSAVVVTQAGGAGGAGFPASGGIPNVLISPAQGKRLIPVMLHAVVGLLGASTIGLRVTSSSGGHEVALLNPGDFTAGEYSVSLPPANSNGLGSLPLSMWKDGLTTDEGLYCHFIDGSYNELSGESLFEGGTATVLCQYLEV